jgi:AraC-like DNA-binding protein
MSSMPHATAALVGGPVLADAYRLFASDDLEETRSQVGRVMKPHKLRVAGAAQRIGARMHHVGFGDTSLSRLRYGAAVSIEPDRLDDFFLVQMPLAGSAAISVGAEQVASTPRLASVLSPSRPIRMRWDADCDQLMVRVPRGAMERAAAAQLGHELDEPLHFAPALAWRDEPTWWCLMNYLLDCAAQGIDFRRHHLLAAQVDQLVIGTLLGAQPHNHLHRAPARAVQVLPRHVKRVDDYLHAHADEAISPDQLAQLAGVSLRSLYAGFQQFCGVSPMQQLKRIRLDRARADLLGAAPLETVAGVALRWGFGHLGRFSADYRERFGEGPAQTLRRRS